MSVGVVRAEGRAHGARRARRSRRALDRYVRETPGGSGAARAGARRVSEVRFDADYSYDSNRYAGDRWLVVGDAGAFLDPIFSTGVLLAMQGGLDAADALDAALAGGRSVAPPLRELRARRRGALPALPALRDRLLRASRSATSSSASDTPLGIREAVISVLAGNWRPSLAHAAAPAGVLRGGRAAALGAARAAARRSVCAGGAVAAHVLDATGALRRGRGFYAASSSTLTRLPSARATFSRTSRDGL